MIEKKIIAIYGPTASGKTNYALKLCEKYDGIIVNADSLQLFMDLSILTATPSILEMQTHPHFLYGILQAYEQPTAMFWFHKVEEVIKKNSGKKIILVGGTGLYFLTFFQGLSPIPVIDKVVENEVFAIQQQKKEHFYQYVIEQDPLVANLYHPNDYKRLSRALSVFLATKKSITSYFKQDNNQGYESDCYKIYLSPERDVLKQRIEKRLRYMFEKGAIEQVEKVYQQNKHIQNLPVFHALGARQIISYLEGQLSYEKMFEECLFKTRQYAKRQYTWFNNQFTHDLVVHDISV